MRLFFGIFPDSETRMRIAAAARALKLDGSPPLVPAENYHMTLAFVGEVPASQVAALLEIGGSQRTRGFTVRFDAYEYWPQARVMVATAREFPASLARLWQQLRTDLAKHKLAPKPIPAHTCERLQPHVTIARRVSVSPVLPVMAAFAWPMQTLSLIHSDTAGARSVYTVVDSWPLLDEMPER
jgi:RNA 2',3'-cyclic 3'-phosphodiesterase